MGMNLMPGFGAFTPTSSLLDGSEADGTNLSATDAGMTSGWTSAAATITTAATAAPNGLTEAAKVVEAAASNAQGVQQTVSFTADSQLRYSVYAKAAERSLMGLACLNVNGTSAGGFCWFNLATGTYIDEHEQGAMQFVNNPVVADAAYGFKKYSIDMRMAADTTAVYWILYVLNSYPPVLPNFPSYTGDGSSGIYVWRPKLVAF